MTFTTKVFSFFHTVKPIMTENKNARKVRKLYIDTEVSVQTQTEEKAMCERKIQTQRREQ